MKKNTTQKNNYYILYTAFFVVLSTLAFSIYFIHNGKSFISNGDGIQQHFNSVIYFGQYIRSIIKNLLCEGKLIIPTWDFNLGMGADIFTTLHYYAFGDPLNLLYIITPTAYSEIMFNFLFFLRLFLAGLSFSFYARRFKKSNLCVLCGTFTYIFCAYIFMIPIIHPYFLNPFIYLPLLLLGIEKIFSKESSLLFIGMVFVSAISNFYFFYMLSILMFLYACIRFFSFYKSDYIKNIIMQLKNFIQYYLIGIMSSAIILLPVIMTTLSTGRSGDSPSIPLLYNSTYYRNILSIFLTYNSVGDYTLLGFGCIPLLLTFYLFVKRKKYTQLKIAFVILSIFTLFPIFGSVFNGFSYVTNRWMFAFSFLIGIIVVFLFNEVHSITKQEIIKLSLMTFIYIFFVVLFSTKADLNLYINIFLLVVSLIIIGFFGKKIFSWTFCRNFFVYFLCLNILINSFYLYSSNEKNYLKSFVTAGGGIGTIKESSNAAVPFHPNEFYRYGTSNNKQFLVYNASSLYGKPSTSGYYSLITDSVTRFSKEILSSTERAETKYAGFDERTIPETLASVKYFSILNGKEQYLPYGFNQKVKSYTTKDKNGLAYKHTYSSYINDHYLPFGYTYDNYITSETWEKYNFLQKEEAMLQTCYIENSESLSTPLNRNVSFLHEELPYTTVASKGLSFNEKEITVKEPNATLTFLFDGNANSETYFYAEDLEYFLPQGSAQTLPDAAPITVDMNARVKTLRLYTPSHNWYNGIKNFAVNAGYETTPPTSITLTFPVKGLYKFNKLSIMSLPFDENYNNSISKLKEDHLENVTFSTNKVTGDITVNQNKILCLSIPYTKGWKGYVDGKEVPLLQTNIMYTGIELSPGKHVIELKYSSPYLKLGASISLIGILLFIIVGIRERKLYSTFKKSQ